MRITDHTQLRIYQDAYALSLEVHQLLADFPAEELYKLADQCSRSSRATPAMIAEAFRKRHYPLLFKSKLLEAEGEAAETRVWLAFARDFGYSDPKKIAELDGRYISLLVRIVNTRLTAPSWCRLQTKNRPNKEAKDDPPH